MLVGHAVSNYEGRSAFTESTDRSQLVKSMTGQFICISESASDCQKHNKLSTRSLLSSIYYGHQFLSKIIKSVSNT